MFPRWLWLNHIPEGLDLSPDQHAQIKRRVREMGPQRRSFASGSLSRRTLIRLAPSVALIILAFALWLVWLIRARPRGAWGIFANVGGTLMFQALLWIAIAWSINRAIAPLVWRALNQAGFRVCEVCGYILENLPRDQTRCPECGHTLHPPIASPSPSPPTT